MINSKVIRSRSAVRATTLALVMLLMFADVASACPSCKETIAADGRGLAEGFSYSVLGMVSMPFLLFAVVGGIIMLAVRRARLRGPEGEPPI